MKFFCECNYVCSSQLQDGQLSPLSLSPDSAAFHPQCSASGDALIADALIQLSLQDRERVYHDIHGVADAIDEKPQFVANCLHEMQMQLDKLTLDNRTQSMAIQLAAQEDVGLVNDQEFRLGFLRSEMFHAERAAGRMMRFFDWKLQLFGVTKLCHDITLEDLEPEDMALLRKGYFQVLPQRDRAGRRVDVFLQANQKYASPESLGRVLFLVRQAKEQNEGEIVSIAIHQCEPNFASMDTRITEHYNRSSQDLPIKVNSFHHCVSDSSSSMFRLFLDFLLQPSELETRARVRVHTGSHTEWLHSLMTYGLPRHLIPVTAPDRTIKLKNHVEFLRMWKTREQFMKQDKLRTIMLPMPLDVLLGRGKPIVEYSGNLRLHALVGEYLPRFSDTKSRNEKLSLASEIVSTIKTSSGRFLSKECGIWVEVDDGTAFEKVNRQFRKHLQAVKVSNCQVMESKDGAGAIRGLPMDSPQPESKRVKTL